MKRSLYSVGDEEEEVETTYDMRHQEEDGLYEEPELAAVEGGSRHHTQEDQLDLWEAFVEENWSPALEKAFGPNWREKYPEEVSAILLWALNFRNRMHMSPPPVPLTCSSPPDRPLSPLPSLQETLGEDGTSEVSYLPHFLGAGGSEASGPPPPGGAPCEGLPGVPWGVREEGNWGSMGAHLATVSLPHRPTATGVRMRLRARHNKARTSFGRRDSKPPSNLAPPKGVFVAEELSNLPDEHVRGVCAQGPEELGTSLSECQPINTRALDESSRALEEATWPGSNGECPSCGEYCCEDARPSLPLDSAVMTHSQGDLMQQLESQLSSQLTLNTAPQPQGGARIDGHGDKGHPPHHDDGEVGDGHVSGGVGPIQEQPFGQHVPIACGAVNGGGKPYSAYAPPGSDVAECGSTAVDTGANGCLQLGPTSYETPWTMPVGGASLCGGPHPSCQHFPIAAGGGYSQLAEGYGGLPASPSCPVTQIFQSWSSSYSSPSTAPVPLPQEASHAMLESLCLDPTTALGVPYILDSLLSCKTVQDILDGSDIRGRSPLHVAAAAGRADIVEQLLYVGCAVNRRMEVDFLSPSVVLDGEQDREQSPPSVVSDASPTVRDPLTVGELPGKYAPVAQWTYTLSAMSQRDRAAVFKEPLSFLQCTALHVAAYHGHQEVVEQLLRVGCDVQARTAQGCTALHFAAHAGHAAVAASLCRAPAIEVDAVDMWGHTALHHAAAKGHADVVEVLWPKGCNMEVVDSGGRTALHFAAEAGHTDVVSKLVIAGCHVQKHDNEGYTAAHLAAMGGYVDVLEKLLLAGYEVDTYGGLTVLHNCGGSTALHMAATYGHAVVVQHLISNRANVMKEDFRGYTALQCAAEGGHQEAFEVLLANKARYTAVDCCGTTVLHSAVQGGNWAIIKRLLDLGCDLKAVSGLGQSVLHFAARGGSLEIMARLVALGADVYAKDADGSTPWHVAVELGHWDIVERLMALGINVDERNNAGSTALHSVAKSGKVEAVEFLLQCGADVAATSREGETPLHYAAEVGNYRVMEHLLLKADEVVVNIQDKCGWTALHHATEQGHCEMAVMLYEKGAKVDMLTKEGWTPLHLAAKEMHLPMAQKLLSWGCPKMVRDKDGCLALHYAAQRGDLDLFNMLFEGPDLLKAKDDKGFTLLHYAVEGGHTGIVSTLLNGGLVEEDDLEGTSGAVNALHLACRMGHKDTVMLLLEQGYNPMARALGGQLPLHFVAMGAQPMVSSGSSMATAIANAPAVAAATAAAATGPGPPGSCASLPSSQTPSLPLPEHKAPEVLSAPGSHQPSSWQKTSQHYEILESLLARGSDPLALDDNGCSGLHYAAGSGQVRLVEKFVGLGGDPQGVDHVGWTPMHWAAAGGHASVLSYLLSLECPPNPSDCHGRTPLHWATERGHVAAVSALVDASVAAQLDVHAPDGSGSSAAQLAACKGHVEVVAKLLESGKTKEVKGLTALHLAAQNGLDQVVAQLVGVAGCDVNARDAEGLTPLHWAAIKGSVSIVSRLVQCGADVNAASADGSLPLHKAAAANHLEVVEKLIECSSSISFKTVNGCTALHNAAQSGHIAVCEKLVHSGCPVNAKSTTGCTALYCAASTGQLEVVDFLLKMSSEVDDPTTSGCTPLHIAASNGHAAVVQLLIDRGADKDFQASNGHTALHNAVTNGHLEVVDTLVDCGCDLDIQNSNGNTAIHIAASKGNMEMVNKLLAAGADVHIKSSKQWQAVHSAASNGFLEVVLRLVQHGATWRSKGEVDVVKLICRKSTYKATYVEGRLKLAERERHRVKAKPAVGNSLTSSPSQTLGPTATVPAEGVLENGTRAVLDEEELQQLAAAADANMQALLEEEEVKRQALEEAAERKKAKKKNKKKKSKEVAKAGEGAPKDHELVDPGVDSGRDNPVEQSGSGNELEMEDKPASVRSPSGPLSVTSTSPASSPRQGAHELSSQVEVGDKGQRDGHAKLLAGSRGAPVAEEKTLSPDAVPGVSDQQVPSTVEAGGQECSSGGGKAKKGSTQADGRKKVSDSGSSGSKKTLGSKPATTPTVAKENGSLTKGSSKSKRTAGNNKKEGLPKATSVLVVSVADPAGPSGRQGPPQDSPPASGESGKGTGQAAKAKAAKPRPKSTTASASTRAVALSQANSNGAGSVPTVSVSREPVQASKALPGRMLATHVGTRPRWGVARQAPPPPPPPPDLSPEAWPTPEMAATMMATGSGGRKGGQASDKHQQEPGPSSKAGQPAAEKVPLHAPLLPSEDTTPLVAEASPRGQSLGSLMASPAPPSGHASPSPPRLVASTLRSDAPDFRPAAPPQQQNGLSSEAIAGVDTLKDRVLHASSGGGPDIDTLLPMSSASGAAAPAQYPTRTGSPALGYGMSDMPHPSHFVPPPPPPPALAASWPGSAMVQPYPELLGNYLFPGHSVGLPANHSPLGYPCQGHQVKGPSPGPQLPYPQGSSAAPGPYSRPGIGQKGPHSMQDLAAVNRSRSNHILGLPSQTSGVPHHHASSQPFVSNVQHHLVSSSAPTSPARYSPAPGGPSGALTGSPAPQKIGIPRGVPLPPQSLPASSSDAPSNPLASSMISKQLPSSLDLHYPRVSALSGPLQQTTAPYLATAKQEWSRSRLGQAAPQAGGPTEEDTLSTSSSYPAAVESVSVSSGWEVDPSMFRTGSSNALAALATTDTIWSNGGPGGSSIWSNPNLHGTNGVYGSTRNKGAGEGLAGGKARGPTTPVARVLFPAGEGSSAGSTSPEGLADSGVYGQFRCPLTKKIMKDPVVASDGFTYERLAIEKWVAENDSSPVTQKPLTNKDLVPNMTMRAAIQLLAQR